MKNIMKLFILLAFIVVAFSGFSQNEIQDDDTKYATELLKQGTPAPDFKMKTSENKNFKFSKFSKGKYVVVDFWASWCPDCRKDAPNIVEMYDRFHNKGLEFVGVSYDTDREKWLAGIQKLNLPYTQVSELLKMSQSEVAAAYGVKWIPSIYLIDPDGKVILSTVMSEKITKKLEEIFENK